MKNPKLIFAAVIGVVFCFAGYNLWSYFKEQQAIQIEEDMLAEERRVARAAEKRRKAEERAAKEAEEAAASEQERLAQEEREAEETRQLEEARIAADAATEAKRAAAEKEKANREAARIAERTREARTLTTIREIQNDIMVQLSQLSPRYITDKPEEFLTQTFGPRQLGTRSRSQRLVYDGTNPLMLYAAIDQNQSILEALLGIGMNINAANEAGFTPLMFAAAYAYPETVEYLIGQGADVSAQAYKMDLNALHLAALLNPDPDVIDVLLDAGFSIEGPTSNGYTPLVLAASDNPNFEVAERLAALGADRSAYDEKGRTAKALIEDRINGNGDVYVKISNEVNERVLDRLTP